MNDSETDSFDDNFGRSASQAGGGSSSSEKNTVEESKETPGFFNIFSSFFSTKEDVISEEQDANDTVAPSPTPAIGKKEFREPKPQSAASLIVSNIFSAVTKKIVAGEEEDLCADFFSGEKKIAAKCPAESPTTVLASAPLIKEDFVWNAGLFHVPADEIFESWSMGIYLRR